MNLNDLQKIGFNFADQNAIGFKPNSHEDISYQLATDSALVTTPNTLVPAELTAFIDPMVVEIFTAPRRARELASEVKKGDWSTSYAKFRLDENVGTTQGYSDYASGATSDINMNWATRQQYLFQTTLKYGDLETAISSVAKVDLASRKQRACATVLDIDYNKFALLGVKDRQIYGLLNDPNLPNAIMPKNVSGVTKWKDKTTVQIYNDILELFSTLSKQSDGLIDYNSPLTLAVGPGPNVCLGSATDFNVSVIDMLMKNFTNLKIAVVPELGNLPEGETVMLFAREVNGAPTAEIGYSIKVQAHRLVPNLSSFEQKWTSSTYGTIVYMPYAYARMQGV